MFELQAVFDENQMERIQTTLKDLRDGTQAHSLFLADPAGRPVTWLNQVTEAQAMTLSTLAAGSFAAASEMARLVKPDAVFVLTPPTVTGPVGLECLTAGVATFLEKPPGITVAETRDLLAAARSSGAKAMVGFNRRFEPLVREAKRLIEAEGPLVSVLVEFHTYNPDYWRLRRPEEIIANWHV